MSDINDVDDILNSIGFDRKEVGVQDAHNTNHTVRTGHGTFGNRVIRDGRRLRHCHREARQCAIFNVMLRHRGVTGPYVAVDCGSGKGGDNEWWSKVMATRHLVQIEPNDKSVECARDRVQLQKADIAPTRVTIVNGFGQDAWNDGAGSKNAEDRDIAQKLFSGPLRKGVDIVVANMSVQFMVRDETQFRGFITNIDNCLMPGGIVAIMFMNGDAIAAHLGRRNGTYAIYGRDHDRKEVFKVVSRYGIEPDGDFGNAIDVFFRGVQGLDRLDEMVPEFLLTEGCLKRGFTSIGLVQIEKTVRMRDLVMDRHASTRLKHDRQQLTDTDLAISSLFSMAFFQKKK